MLRFKPQLLIFLSGIPYFVVGIMLNRKGLGFISEAVRLSADLPSLTLPFARPLLSLVGDAALITLVIAAFVLGIFKGRKVIVPAVERNVARIQTFSGPAPLSSLYDKKGWIILGVMMLLGISINNLPIPIDIRGFIDITVGIGLIQGAVASLRLYRTLKPA